MEKKEIFTLADVKKEGKEIAFIKGNRELANNNISSKVKSLSECGTNLVPIMVVGGKKAVDDGCSLVLPDGEDIADDVEKYLVIVDGQHRYKAAMNLMEKEKDNDKKTITDDSIRFFLDYSGRDTKELLAVTNIESAKWKAKDYAKGAVLYNPDDKVAKFANEYLEKGISISTISIYLFGQSGVLTQSVLGKLMKKEKVKYNKNLHLELAVEALPLLIDKLGIKFVKTRYCADGLYNTFEGRSNDEVIDAIKNLKKEDVRQITSATTDEKQSKFETLLKARIN